MNKNKIVSSVKRQEEEKVGFSLKLPVSLKERLQKLAEKESISMNALIVATLQSLIDDDCGKELSIAKNILTQYQVNLSKDIDVMEDSGLDQDNYQAYMNTVSTNEQIKQLLKD